MSKGEGADKPPKTVDEIMREKPPGQTAYLVTLFIAALRSAWPKSTKDDQ